MKYLSKRFAGLVLPLAFLFAPACAPLSTPETASQADEISSVQSNAQAQRRREWAGSLFSGAEQYENFDRITQFIPFRVMKASADPFRFPIGESFDLPTKVTGLNGDIETAAFLEETDTVALLVLHDGKIVYENYWLTGGVETQWLSMSMAKSVTSAAIGAAVDEGLIDINQPVERYVPSLKGSGYEGASVKNVLQASTGIAWDETYSSPDSSVSKMRRIMGEGGSMGDLARSMTREFEPDTRFRYSSMETFVLGMVLSNATGKTVSQYMQEKLWSPLGMEADGYWLLDSDGAEMTQFGLNATARDYAKIGELYRLKGRFAGRRVLSEEWVWQSVTADKEIRQPKPDELGYGYQWWLPIAGRSDFAALGVYHQSIIVSPDNKLTVVRLSAYSDYATPNAPEGNYYPEWTALLFAIIAKLNASDDNSTGG